MRRCNACKRVFCYRCEGKEEVKSEANHHPFFRLSQQKPWMLNLTVRFEKFPYKGMVIYMKKILDAYELSNDFKEIKDFYAYANATAVDINKKVDHLLKCIREVQNFPIFSTVSSVRVFERIYDDDYIQQMHLVIDAKKRISLFITHVVYTTPRYYSFYLLSSDIVSIAQIEGNWREIKKYLKQMRYNDRLLGLKHKRG